MKNLIKFIIVFLGISLFASCTLGGGNPSQKRSSSGKTLEVLFVANKNVYSGETRQLVDSLFKQPQATLNQPEPIFDVVNVPVSSFENTDMYHYHRNIILVDLNAENKNKVYLDHNKWAYPQVVFQFSINNLKELKPLLEKHFNQICEEIYKNEHIRVNKAFDGIENLDITKQLKDNFGFWVTVSNEFILSTLTPDFAWIRKEAKDFSIGVLVYTQPYSDTNVFQERHILDNLDSVMKQYIPGPADGSYMAIERKVEPVSKRILFDDRYCIETRGLWRLVNDFMGGPFVNYTFTSPDNKQLIMLTGYVYSPRKPKRDFLMQAESICYSIQFLKSRQ